MAVKDKRPGATGKRKEVRTMKVQIKFWKGEYNAPGGEWLECLGLFVGLGRQEFDFLLIRWGFAIYHKDARTGLGGLRI